MRDARSGGGTAKPPKRSNIAAQLARYNRQHGPAPKPISRRVNYQPKRTFNVPVDPVWQRPQNLSRAKHGNLGGLVTLGTLGKYTIGMGMATPSEMIHTASHPLSGRGPSHPQSITAPPSLGIVPFIGARASTVRPAAWGEGGGGIPKGPGMPKTNADLEKIAPVEPPVKPGHVRLYRGEGPRPPTSTPIERANAALYARGGQGQWFSDSREYAEKYRRSGGSLHYVDVPKEHVERYRFAKNEYIIPKGVAGGSRPITETVDETGRTSAGAQAGGKKTGGQSVEHRPEAAEKVIEGLKKGHAKSVYREQKQLRHEELSKRVEAAQEALAKGTGDEAFRAAKRELRGPLPKAEFHGLRNLTGEEMAALKRHIQNHPDLTFFDKTTAEEALRNAHEHGQVPASHEYRALEKAFGQKFMEQNFPPSLGAKVAHAAIETVNIPRAVMSSVDVSAPGRQGLVGLISHPIVSGKELGPMVKALGSEPYYRGWRQAIESDPEYEGFVKHGGAATDIEHSLASREEPFQSNYAERIPVAGHLVRSSGRAYNRFLVGQRFAIYKHLKNYADRTGRSLDDKGLTDLAALVNDATGRGTGRRGGFLERNAVALNATFFSPRLIKSRFSFLNPKSYMRLDPFVRREKIKMAAQTAAAISTFLYAMSRVAGVKVGHDPRSSDFGKMKIGNTRIDVGGGFSQYIRVFAQGIANGEIDPNTGEITHGQTLDILNRFARGKLAPSVSLGADLLLRSNYAGQHIDPTSIKYWESRAGSMLTPLAGQDAYAVQQQTHNPLAALGAYGLSATGVGVQSYGPPKPTGKTADDLRADLAHNVKQYFHRGLTPQLKEALHLRQTREEWFKRILPKRPGRGASDEDRKTYALHRFNAQVDLLVKLKKINRRQAHAAKTWAQEQDRHKVNSETSRVGRKYFGGDALSDAAKKIREKGGNLYLGDY